MDRTGSYGTGTDARGERAIFLVQQSIHPACSACAIPLLPHEGILASLYERKAAITALPNSPCDGSEVSPHIGGPGVASSLPLARSRHHAHAAMPVCLSTRTRQDEWIVAPKKWPSPLLHLFQCHSSPRDPCVIVLLSYRVIHVFLYKSLVVP